MYGSRAVKVGLDKGTGSHNTGLQDFYVVDEHVAAERDDAALLEAERSILDTNPDNGRAGRLSDLSDADRIDTTSVQAH